MIHIDEQTCIGCTKCTKVCPGNLLVMKNGKSTSREPRACWSCTACIKECPVQAIALYTGADAGGRGGLLYAKDSGDILTWTFQSVERQTKTIEIQKNQSNNY